MSDGRTGEQLERARRQRKAWTIGAIGAAGMVTGFAVGSTEAGELFPVDGGGWPPAMALAVVASYLTAMLIGGIVLARQTDEVERIGQYKAASAACLVYMLVYPSWFVLWMGNLAPEPMHGPLFLLIWVTLAASMLFYKFR